MQDDALKTLLATMPREALEAIARQHLQQSPSQDDEPIRIQLGDGITLYKQAQSKKWHVRIHQPEKRIRDVRRTTGTADLAAAKTLAFSLAAELALKAGAGIPLKRETNFATIAKTVTSYYQKRAKKNDHYYLSVLDNHILPWFGKRPIASIGDREIRQFWNEYTEARGTPSKTFVTTANVVIKRVLQEALEQHLIASMPDFKGKAETKSGKSGEAWSPQQITDIFAKLDAFAGDDPKRVLFKRYCKFLHLTGVRTGDEPLGLTWGDIRSIKGAKGLDYYARVRKGKMGESRGNKGREILLSKAGSDSSIWSDVLSPIAKAQGYTGFRDADPSRLIFEGLKQPSDYWRKVPEVTGTLYWFRHTYITSAIVAGVPMAEIAAQCGTSQEMIEQTYSHATMQLFRARA